MRFGASFSRSQIGPSMTLATHFHWVPMLCFTFMSSICVHDMVLSYTDKEWGILLLLLLLLLLSTQIALSSSQRATNPISISTPLPSFSTGSQRYVTSYYVRLSYVMVSFFLQTFFAFNNLLAANFCDGFSVSPFFLWSLKIRAN